MISAEELIYESIIKCKEKGIEIRPGARLWFDNNFVPYACNCFGAVDIILGSAIPLDKREKGWYKHFCVEILGKSEYWVWHFGYGFNQGRALEIYTEDKPGKRIYTEDKTSSDGSKLARKIGLFI
jgi:hypothetical protein